MESDAFAAGSLVHRGLREEPGVPVSAVRIWTAQLESLSSGEVELLSAGLDVGERARAARFRFPKDRRDFAATRGLLRVLLGSLLDYEPAALVFEYGAHGKPALPLPHQRDLHFNISHSRGFAMFAVSRDGELGIDLESSDRLQANDEHLSALAARILSSRERVVWEKLPTSEDRQAAFLRAWTRKESCAKATGRGVFDGFREVEVALDASIPARSCAVSMTDIRSGLTTPWLVHDLTAPDGFFAALCHEAKPQIQDER